MNAAEMTFDAGSIEIPQFVAGNEDAFNKAFGVSGQGTGVDTQSPNTSLDEARDIMKNLTKRGVSPEELSGASVGDVPAPVSKLAVRAPLNNDIGGRS